MALIKEYETPQGVTGNYWIAESYNNKRENKTTATLILYKDAQTRADNKQPLFMIDAGVFEGTYLTGKQLYAAILERVADKDSHLSFLSGAVNDEE